MPAVASPAPPDTVIHLLGRVNDEVAAQVGRVIEALADCGVQQTVIVLDDPTRRHLLASFDARARLILGQVQGGPGRSLPALVKLLCDEAESLPAATVHLHGVVPCLLGSYAARFRGLHTPLHFSPYGSRQWRFIQGAAALVLWTLRPRTGEPARRTITSRAAEVSTLQQLTHQPVDLVEGSVDTVFFNSPRRESRRPLVVTSTPAQDPRGAARFAQLAVLLSEESLALGFNWIGPTDAESAAQLDAAGAGRFEAPEAAARIARLRSAWVYVAVGTGAGFPSALVEAMALGLPCVAWATPPHQEVLRHGETGMLCASEDELLACIASLVDSAEYRQALGAAAREEALQRFHRSTFSASLLASYSAAPTPEHEGAAGVGGGVSVPTGELSH